MLLLRRLSLWTLLGAIVAPQASHAQAPTREEAVEAMHRAVMFFREDVSTEGGYVYRVSSDLAKFEGEGMVGPMTAWIEPPGTPAVGMAYLEAYQLTHDPLLLEAAVETGMALVKGQLESGGWDNMIEFDPAERRRYRYRVDENDGSRLRNTTTFDDDKSQSALRFLMQLDRVLEFEEGVIHEATMFGLKSFLAAQYPNGAWPQRFSELHDSAEYPVVEASYPESWSREFPGDNYQSYYTLNDNTISDLIETMLDAYDVYGEEAALESAKRGGEFFLLAQMPEPQPGWAQQYTREMHPAWARKFEPPAISGSESQGVMRTLLLLYDRTGDERFLEPIPRAIEYFRSSLRDDGRLARFYELGSNRPLYFTKDYVLTYSDDDMPTHYAFIVGSRLDSIEEQYERLRERGPREQAPSFAPSIPRMSDRLANDAREVIDALDQRGAWVEEGRLQYHGDEDDTREVIESETFIDRLDVLARYIAASTPQ